VFSDVSKQLHSTDKAIREKGLETLLLIGGWAKQRELVTSALSDPELPIVRKALQALVGDPECGFYEGYLRHLAIHDAPEIRARACAWLAERDNPDNAEVFLSLIPKETGETRKLLVDGLGRMLAKDPDAMAKRVVERLGDSSLAVREMAADLYTQLPSKDAAFAIFMDYAISTVDWVRAAMYEQIQKHADAFVDPLLAYLTNDAMTLQRPYAFALALTLQDDRLLPLLLQTYERSEDWLARYQVVDALARIESKEADAVLLKALAQHETVLPAIQGLARRKNPAYAQNFLQLLPKSQPDVQLALLEALEVLPIPKLLPILDKFFRHPGLEPEVRSRTAQAIGVLCENTKQAIPDDLQAVIHEARGKRLESLSDVTLTMRD
jgi:HEAT repeat protein